MVDGLRIYSLGVFLNVRITTRNHLQSRALDARLGKVKRGISGTEQLNPISQSLSFPYRTYHTNLLYALSYTSNFISSLDMICWSLFSDLIPLPQPAHPPIYLLRRLVSMLPCQHHEKTRGKKTKTKIKTGNRVRDTVYDARGLWSGGEGEGEGGVYITIGNGGGRGVSGLAAW